MPDGCEERKVQIMKQKNIVITGANSGIGKAISLRLAREGVNVIMVCRDALRGQAAKDEIKEASGSSSIQLYIADLSSIESIKTLGNDLCSDFDKIDVLINNAGVISPKRQVTVDGLENQFAVNYIAPLVLSTLLKTKLALSDDGRIINVSSGAHKAGKLYLDDLQLKDNYRAFRAYGQSKLAVTMLTMLQAKVYKNLGISVNCFHPGAVGTSISVDRDTESRLRLMKWLSIFMLTPDEGAITAIHLALNKSLEHSTGGYYYKNKLAKTNQKVEDELLKQQLLKKTFDLLRPFGISEL